MPRYLVSGIAALVSDVAAVLREHGAEVVEVDDIGDVPRVCADAGAGAFDGYVQLPASFTVEGDTAVSRVHHFFAAPLPALVALAVRQPDLIFGALTREQIAKLHQSRDGLLEHVGQAPDDA